MDRFQPGERAYFRLVFGHEVPLLNANVQFVHKDDDTEHVMFGFRTENDETAMKPTQERLIDMAVAIPGGKKPGKYCLGRIYFETFGNKIVDIEHNHDVCFEVIEESTKPPVVRGVSVFREFMWNTIRSDEEKRGR